MLCDVNCFEIWYYKKTFGCDSIYKDFISYVSNPGSKALIHDTICLLDELLFLLCHNKEAN